MMASRQGRFLKGSTMSHVVRMTLTGTFGITFMFLVDAAAALLVVALTVRWALEERPGVDDVPSADTTTTARERPETIRLRAGKWRACGEVPIGASESRNPARPISSPSTVFSPG